ncbi:YlxR family protein [Actinocorallia sp. A-T 12471]|uniref:YlxR family protein n=1 Tax=Actinocorallia sp. A-T 12471 TaxID=3089813 RepID=UPI0029D177F8|nr:YlxR family protein [Actinocorallia sp. A-T 12471]MDX6743407.1 YlxR family protein [Actinocorallia sp. A-T 12471]
MTLQGDNPRGTYRQGEDLPGETGRRRHRRSHRRQRTCVGCRDRAVRADLLRVVAEGGVLVPDPRKRLPGRGASVHPDSRCLELAIRRRAFSRALRLEALPDSSVLLRYVQGSEET